MTTLMTLANEYTLSELLNKIVDIEQDEDNIYKVNFIVNNDIKYFNIKSNKVISENNIEYVIDALITNIIFSINDKEFKSSEFTKEIPDEILNDEIVEKTTLDIFLNFKKHIAMKKLCNKIYLGGIE